MATTSRYGWRNIDWIALSVFLSLMAIGWALVFSVNYGELGPDTNFFSSTAGKQSVWMFIALVVFAVVMVIDWKFWQTFNVLIYLVSILLLVGVLFLGSHIKGGTSWYAFGGFSFQPSELAKFGVCLALAGYLSKLSTNLRHFRSQLFAFGIIALPVGLIMAQPDAGSAITFLSFFILLYREGLSPNIYAVGFFLAGTLLLSLLFNPVIVAVLIATGGFFVMANNFREPKHWRRAALAVAAGVAVLLWFKQDWVALGLALAGFIPAFFLHFARYNTRLAGMLSLVLIVGSGLALSTDYAFNNILKPHQQDRINVWLHPERAEARGARYNVLQSQMAISSGGLEGKGFLEGAMTKMNYVPEQSTDFIFCTVGEEQGFIGSVIVIGLFLTLLLRIVFIAERQRSNFSRHYAYGVAGLLFIHFFVNIGMTMGLLPIIGIPLPLISKGGSALIGFTLMIAVLLKLDSNRYSL
jgi:rod shape determining protein RodA